jgi:hypothetical protein
MKYALLGLLLWSSCILAAQERLEPSWRTDVDQARAEALRDRKPCVLILNIDKPDL